MQIVQILYVVKWKKAAQDFSSPWTEAHVVLKAIFKVLNCTIYLHWLQKNAVLSSDLFRQKNDKSAYFWQIALTPIGWLLGFKDIIEQKSKVDIFGHFLVSEKVSRPLFIQFRERKKVLPDSSSAAQFTTYYLNDPKKNANFFPVTILMAVIYNRKIA